MSGTIEEQFLELGAATAFHLVGGALKSVGNLLSDKNSVQRGMREYARRFLERHGEIKVLNMAEPIPLGEIYVSAQAVSPRILQSYKSIEELQKQFRTDGRRRLTLEDVRNPKRSCLDHANEEQFLNVLGAPGAGKSTFLRRLGLEALRPRQAWSDELQRTLGLKAGLSDADYSQYTHEHLPVLIELRRFRTEEVNLAHHIQSELAICGLPESEALTKSLLDKGHLLILLDGVDEIPGDRLDAAIAHIRDFVDRHSRNRYVASCRTAFYKNYLNRFSDVLLADFDDKQISSFINGWFRSEKDRQQNTAGDLLKALNDPANQSAKELASTPLLLTFLCLSYDEMLRLPPNRSELYRQALEILLFKWANSKRVHNDPVYRDLHPRLEVGMLAEIAAPAFRDGRYFFTRRELIDRITKFLHEELNAPRKLNGDQVLEAIEVQQGLIVQRAQDAWSFSHLTLQEYLTAVWYEQNYKIKELLNNHLGDERWREVFILLAGVVSKADLFLTTMLHSAEKLASTTPATVQILQWANSRVEQTDEEMHDAGRRAYAIVVLRDYGFLASLVGALEENTVVDRVRLITRTISSERSYDRLRTRSLVRQLNGNLDSLVNKNSFPEHILDLNQTIEKIIDTNSLRQYINGTLEFLITLNDYKVLTGQWDEAVAALKSLQAQALSIPGPTEALKIWGTLRSIYADALNLPNELRQWPGDQAALDTYLYACRLIMECKDATTSITRSAWLDICSRMLRAPQSIAPTSLKDRAKK